MTMVMITMTILTGMMMRTTMTMVLRMAKTMAMIPHQNWSTSTKMACWILSVVAKMDRSFGCEASDFPTGSLISKNF